METKRIFKLTKDHIKLLRRMYVSWDTCETGAPAIDPKRPYGNSDVANDIHEILTGESVGCVDSEREELTAAEEEKYMKLHFKTQDALQVVLATGSFEPGTYEAEGYGNIWKRKE